MGLILFGNLSNQGKKIFQIAISPSLPPEMICLSSGLKEIVAIGPE
jgi:hypothetical protein